MWEGASKLQNPCFGRSTVSIRRTPHARVRTTCLWIRLACCIEVRETCGHIDALYCLKWARGTQQLWHTWDESMASCPLSCTGWVLHTVWSPHTQVAMGLGPQNCPVWWPEAGDPRLVRQTGHTEGRGKGKKVLTPRSSLSFMLTEDQKPSTSATKITYKDSVFFPKSSQTRKLKIAAMITQSQNVCDLKYYHIKTPHIRKWNVQMSYSENTLHFHLQKLPRKKNKVMHFRLLNLILHFKLCLSLSLFINYILRDL